MANLWKKSEKKDTKRGKLVKKKTKTWEKKWKTKWEKIKKWQISEKKSQKVAN